jgi:SnoaL-like domain
MTSRDEELQVFLDERAIRRILKQYCRGIDRGDADLVRACYHPGSLDIHGRYRGDGPGFADYAIGVLGERYAATMHDIGEPWIEVDEDAAFVETPCVAYHLSVDPISEAHLYVFGGRYVDRFARRDQQWRIEYRVVVRDWSMRHPIDAEDLDRESEGAKNFFNGRRDRSDIGYAAAFAVWAQSNLVPMANDGAHPDDATAATPRL